MDEKSSHKTSQLCIKIKFCIQIVNFSSELGLTEKDKIKLEVFETHYKICNRYKVILYFDFSKITLIIRAESNSFNCWAGQQHLEVLPLCLLLPEGSIVFS